MAKDKLTLGMDDATFDRLASAMKRNMFLAGLCIGAALTGLGCLGAYGTLSALLALGVVSIAWRGWPWD